MLKKIQLSDFRNFGRSTFDFSDQTTLIVGPNASGKTNILESVFLLATGKSFKARVEEEMVNHGKEIARAKGLTAAGTKLEVLLTRGLIGMGTEREEKIPRKRLLINGVGRRLVDFAANFSCVLFGPWDLDIVTESPSTRRRFLDTVLSQTDREYRWSLLSYEKGLRRRNRILLRIREEGVSRGNLLFWDKLLVKNGDFLAEKRAEFLSFINQSPGLNDQNFEVYYDKSAISEERLLQYKEEEVAAATTLVGPHRDDFLVKVFDKDKPRDLARYGSRGEQRMGVFWLKLAELAFNEKKTDEKPTLLLDDIFSELDEEHRKMIGKLTKTSGQVILTTADSSFAKSFPADKKIRL